MSRLPLSRMLFGTFTGILAVLMLVIAVLLAILITLNTMRGEDAMNGQLMVTAIFFVIGALGFYGLKRWVRGLENK
ncbi:MAG: hypothetical protein AAF739_12970 [Pseudomonadota bacterium]